MENTKEEILEAIKWLEGMRTSAIVVLESGFGSRPGEHNMVYVKRKRLAEVALYALYKQLDELEKSGRVRIREI